MIAARLQYGPFDGHNGQVRSNPLPVALDVTRCQGCGCGRPVHYRVAYVEGLPGKGYSRYELVEVVDDLVLYRHADTLDPATERTITETLRA